MLRVGISLTRKSFSSQKESAPLRVKTSQISGGKRSARSRELKPLFFFLFVVMLAAWIVTWYTHFYRRSTGDSSSDEGDHEKEIP